MTLFVSLIFCLFVQSEPTIQAPDSVVLGSSFEVSWNLVVAERDFVTIVEKGAAEGQYDTYKYAKYNKWQAVAPEKAGEYEIRYLSADSPYPTLSKKALTVTPATATIKAPTSGEMGAQIEIQWEGPSGPREYITIVKPETPEGEYGDYVYVKKGKPVVMTLPEVPGPYEIRYCTASNGYILGKTTITVGSASAKLQAVAQSPAGAPISVTWEGPGNARDFISIVPKGTAKDKYGPYTYTRNGSPLTLEGPEKPGVYEIRYHLGQGEIAIGATEITIGSVSATISVADKFLAGSPVEFTWTGPNNPRDFLTIVPEGAPEKAYDAYVYTKKGSPTSLPAPEKPGAYELRYVTGGEETTLHRVPIQVTAANARLQADDEIKGGDYFKISWEGPGNQLDYVSISKKGAKEREWENYTYIRDGNPVSMKAPLEPGDYQLRYQTGRSNIILATRDVRVTAPDQAPGTLKVVFDDTETASLGQGVGLEVILDASGSMLKRMDGKRRIDIAKAVLEDLVSKKIPAGTPFALRVFGHLEADSCRTDLELPLAPLNPGSTVAAIRELQAKNLAKTPIADSLAQVAKDLASAKGQKVVILITDGEETCGGDPAVTIQALKTQGVDVRVNIVGFAIDDQNLKKTFKLWADLGDGDYFDANNANQLNDSMNQALQVPFDVFNAAGQKMGEGLVGGPAVQLPTGMYLVKTRETPAREITQVEIPSGDEKTVTLR